MSEDVESEDMDEEGGETTLYFDAEEGTIRDEDGNEVILDMDTEDSAEPESVVDEDDEEDEAEGEEEGDEDGAQTPHAAQPDAGAEQQGASQTITSTSPTATASSVPDRPSRLRRLSSVTQSNVSFFSFLVH